MRAKPEMVHCVFAVVQVPPPLEVMRITTALMPVLVKVTDRVVAALAARVTVAVVVSAAIARLLCATYPDLVAL